MSDRDLERLFWEEFDGPTSVRRRQRIEALASERPERRRALEELEELARQLREVEEVPPPPELRAEVRRQVASRPAYGRNAGATPAGWIREALAAGWPVRLAYATLGALIGIFGAYLIASGPSSLSQADRSQLSGAMSVGAKAPPRPFEATLAGGVGTVRLLFDGERLAATLRPAPQETLALSLDRGGGGLAPLQVDGIGASRHEMTTGPGRVRVVADGPISVLLGVDPDGPAALVVRVSTAAGRPLLDESLDLTEMAGGS